MSADAAELKKQKQKQTTLANSYAFLNVHPGT